MSSVAVIAALLSCSTPSDALAPGAVAWSTDLAGDAAPTPGNTPLGMSMSRLVPGDPLTLRAWNASPGDTVYFLFGDAGLGPCVSAGNCLDLTGPNIFASAVADVVGEAEVTMTLPASALMGIEKTFQAASSAGDLSPATNREVGAIRQIADLEFFLQIHTGEGSAPVCITESLDLSTCYAAYPAATDAQLASLCSAEEDALALCETTTLDLGGHLVDDASDNKSCKLENFDLTLDRTSADYNHQLAVRYDSCRDGLIGVLDGLAEIDVKAVIQFHGGFLENLAYEDANGGPFDFQAHVADHGHELSMHHHAECELSTSPYCNDDGVGAWTTDWGTSWGTGTDGPDDSTFPDTQGEADTRLDSLLKVYGDAASFGGYFASATPALTSLSGWGTPYRITTDLQAAIDRAEPVEIQPQFAKLSAEGIGIITTGNEFPSTIEDGCFDGEGETGVDKQRAFPHPMALSDDLMFYVSPNPELGQNGNDDPMDPSSSHRVYFDEHLSCMDTRVAHAADAAGDIPRYDGQLFIWSATSHLHNMIEDDWSQLPDASFGDPEWPSGVVEMAGYRDMIAEMVADFNADESRHLVVGAVNYETLASIEAKRGVESYDFEVRLDAVSTP